jgi:hypothetical protein
MPTVPFNPSITVAQTPLNPSIILITDTSVGTPANPLVSRNVTITDSSGNYIVPSGTTTNYIPWAIGESFIALDILTQDMALNIKVDWLQSGNVVEYTYNQNYSFTQFSKQFLYYLIQLQSQNYNIIQDNNYWGNVGIFWTNIIGAINSVEIGNDIASAQACLNRTNYMQQNQSIYF